jgi:hypothetical protein
MSATVRRRNRRKTVNRKKPAWRKWDRPAGALLEPVESTLTEGDAAGALYGAEQEARALVAVNLLRTSWPAWIFAFRAATPGEDGRGWDLVAETDRGCCGVQIKASNGAGVTKHRERYPGVPVIVAGGVDLATLGVLVLDAARKSYTEAS